MFQVCHRGQRNTLRVAWKAVTPQQEQRQSGVGVSLNTVPLPARPPPAPSQCPHLKWPQEEAAAMLASERGSGQAQTAGGSLGSTQGWAPVPALPGTPLLCPCAPC